MSGLPIAWSGRTCIYLPFMEVWPTPMAEYKWNDSSWEAHWKVAGPIEEGFSRKYQDQWVAVMRDFIGHVKAKDYRTRFQVYLNDKYYHVDVCGGFFQFPALAEDWRERHGQSIWPYGETPSSKASASRPTATCTTRISNACGAGSRRS